MGSRVDSFDLNSLRLSSGEARRLELEVTLAPLTMSEHSYAAQPATVRLEVTRTTGQGYALRLRFAATLAGPCMRCLEPATPSFALDTREISQPGDGPDLDSPYVEHGTLDLGAWAHDSLVLALPATVLCRPDCAGLCPVCGADLNGAGPEHHHDLEPDPRWARLSELKFD